MSRIGKKPILIPEGVQVTREGTEITAKGPKGELKREIRPEVKVIIEKDKVVLELLSDAKAGGAIWGLTRSLINNMVVGVSSGYEKRLQLEGIGYKASLDGEDLVLNVGFSHPVRIKKERGISFTVEKNIIIVSGPDKEAVGDVAASVRRVRPPEPYKGKGIRYEGEKVRKKAGKKVAAAAGAA